MSTMRQEVVLTFEGIRKLEEELDNLKTVKRQEVAERIKTAIDFGDISENAEYDEAKNDQAFIEGRIMALENMLRSAKVVDNDDVRTDVANVGCSVRVLDLDEQEELTYMLVGSMEADPLRMRISNESPVGAALIGKAAGDEIKVAVPAGTLRMRILSIHK